MAVKCNCRDGKPLERKRLLCYELRQLALSARRLLIIVLAVQFNAFLDCGGGGTLQARRPVHTGVGPYIHGQHRK